MSNTGADHHWPLTWIGSDRFLARGVVRPVARFLRIEAASGLLLLATSLIAIVWANSPAFESYFHLWETTIDVKVGGFQLELTLHEFVNDALMALFFFVAGLEIKREMVVGELRDRRAAAMPVLAALGGMVVPALIFAAVNVGGEGFRGWGIPMATDIAFAVGIVSLLGPRVPAQLKLFLLTLAVADDLGAIAVIATVYSSGLLVPWLALAAGTLVAVYLFRRSHVWYKPVYVVLGVIAWYAMFRSGVHATVAGVSLGFLTPVAPLKPELKPEEIADQLEVLDDITAADVRAAAFHLRETVPVADRLIDVLLPWTSFLIIPIFALANAGVRIDGGSLGATLTSRVTVGVVLGLVVGKTIGVCGMAYLAAKLGIGKLPRGATFLHMVGISMAAGIGFTVALFVAGLAFTSAALQDQAKVGIFIASFVAAVLSAIVLSAAAKRVSPEERALEEEEDAEFFAEEPVAAH